MKKRSSKADNFEETLKSYWLDSTPKTNYPSLKEDITVDAAVIGGGIAGITAAFLLMKEGLKVALIDADRIIQGTSGHTTAKITSQHNLIYDKLINSIGIDKAKQYANANEAAIKFIANIIKEYNINCDFKRAPAYLYTEDSEYTYQIEQESYSASRLGINAKYLDTLPLPLEVKAALCFENQAEFHPRKYLLALAEQIPLNGSYIFENTKIVDVNNGNPCELKTHMGNKITAAKVIIASHVPCYDGFGLYFSRLRPERSYALAIKIKEKFPEGMFINVEEPRRSLRSQIHDGSELILVGGENHKTAHGKNTLEHYENLKTFSTSIFNVENILYRWSAQDYITLDGVPYIGNLTSSTENVYVATGFRKWGMTNGTVSGILLKDLIINNESPWQEVYSPSRFTPAASAKKFIIENFDVAKEFLIGKVKLEKNDLDLEKFEGKVVKIEGDKYGAYKDELDNVHLVDITCTHMGCELKWNAAEKSWDCPCHGSRFTYEGDIIEGPAINPLNHYKEDPNNIDANIF